MTLNGHLKRLDFFLNYDLKARNRAFTHSLMIVPIVVSVCYLASISEPTILSCCLVSSAAVLAFHLFRYESTEGLSLVGDRQLLAVDRTLHSTFPSRRLALVKVSVILISVLALVFRPRLTAAQIVNDRIRRLKATNRRPDARKAAEEANKAGIPLDPDLVSVLGDPEILTTDGMFESVKSIGGEGGATVRQIVKLSTGDLLQIHLPILYLSAKSYLIKGELDYVSMTGEGSDFSRILVAIESEPRIPSLFRHNLSPSSDVLLYGIAITGPDGKVPPYPTQFILPVQATRKTAVSNVYVKGFIQNLDGVIWDQTTFESCTVSSGGSAFKLNNVVFKDCSFELDGLPDEVAKKIVTSNGKAVSLELRR